MSLHLTLKIASDTYTWEIWNATPTRARDEVNLYCASRSDERPQDFTAVAGISHTPTDGAGPLIEKVMRHLPPPNPDMPVEEGWVMITGGGTK